MRLIRTPVLTVVIPVREGARYLGRCLDALRAAEPEIDCVVVDDGSFDSSGAVAEAHGATVLRTSAPLGPAAARNLGAAAARGDVVVFLDADVCVHPNTMARIRTRFRDDPSLDALIGSYDDCPADPGFFSQYKNLQHHYVHQNAKPRAATFWTGCGAVRREVFLAAGGFDESYKRPCIEDIELGCHLTKSGRRILLDRAIQVTHLKRYTMASLVRSDIFDRAIPWTRLILSRSCMPDDLNLTIPQRACGILVTIAALLSTGVFGLTGLALACALLLASAALNRHFYLFLASRRGWRFVPGAVLMHWLYHFYSSAGFVAGAILQFLDPPSTPRAEASLSGCSQPDSVPPCSQA